MSCPHSKWKAISILYNLLLTNLVIILVCLFLKEARECLKETQTTSMAIPTCFWWDLAVLKTKYLLLSQRHFQHDRQHPQPNLEWYLQHLKQVFRFHLEYYQENWLVFGEKWFDSKMGWFNLVQTRPFWGFTRWTNKGLKYEVKINIFLLQCVCKNHTIWLILCGAID